MAAEYKHKRYFRLKKADNSYHAFQDLSDANTMLVFKDAWNTNSPTITKALEDSNQTLVVTIEHSSADNQTGWKTAVDNLWDSATSSAPWEPLKKGALGVGIHEWTVEHFKTEWLHADGSISQTTTLIS